MRRRFLALAAVAGLLLSMSLVAPAAAVVPVDIEVSPQHGYINVCAVETPVTIERRYWTVYLSGGTTGLYKVVVNYGDGSAVSTTWQDGQYDTHHDFYCQHGYYYQNWSGWRSGGTTGTYSTWVYTYS